MRPALARWLPVLLWAAAVLAAAGPWAAASSTGALAARWLGALGLDAATARAVHFALRKAGHFVAYAVFGALGARAMRPGRSAVRAWALAIVLSAVLAGADETLQSLVGERTGSPWDVLLDLCGASVGAAFLLGTPARR